MNNSYTINIINNDYATVSHNKFGYCENFYGNTYKSDAIKYIKQVGGNTAKFEFKHHGQ